MLERCPPNFTHHIVWRKRYCKRCKRRHFSKNTLCLGMRKQKAVAKTKKHAAAKTKNAVVKAKQPPQIAKKLLFYVLQKRSCLIFKSFRNYTLSNSCLKYPTVSQSKRYYFCPNLVSKILTVLISLFQVLSFSVIPFFLITFTWLPTSNTGYFLVLVALID